MNLKRWGIFVYGETSVLSGKSYENANTCHATEGLAL